MTLTCMAVLLLSACLSVCCFNYMYVTITGKLLYKQGPHGSMKVFDILIFQGLESH